MFGSSRISASRVALAAFLFLTVIVAVSSQQHEAARAIGESPVGPQPNGRTVLPNGWKLTPAGKQIPLSTLPMSVAVSPDEKYAVVLNGGFLPPTLSVIDLSSGQETSRVPIRDGWHGLTFGPKGEKVYVGGGSEVSVFEFSFRDGKLSPGKVLPVRPADKRGLSDHVGDVALSPDGRFLYVANLFRNSITVMNAETAFVVGEIPTGYRPYRILMGLDGKTALVSHWAESSIGLYSLSDRRLLERISVGPHPTDMLLMPGEFEAEDGELPIVARLFVACANTNSVWVLGMTEGNRFRQLQRIVVSPTPLAPAGSTPTALALSADGNRLYVVCSGNNAIVVVDVSEDRARVIGAIPTGWYPTDVAKTSDGSLLYLNGKGAGSHAAPRGPDPTRRGEEQQYVAALQTGSMGLLPALSADELDRLTAQVIENTPYDDRLLTDAGVPAGNPIPTRPGAAGPIRHVIYVIKQNRTYDQVLGDIEKGNGDEGLVVFGESITPNHHKLAREFVLFDNFYTAGDVSADGLNWSAAAVANDYVEKMWPSYYGRRRKVWDFEGGEPAAAPPAGYLWSNVLGARLSVRNFGMWSDASGSNNSVTVKDPGLAPHTSRSYVPFQFEYADGKRVDEFLRELSEFEAKEEMPRLTILSLPGDHTAGRAPGMPTAEATMAEHDYALGRLVEAVSRSQFWPQTAIFVVEDDSQDGADHIDSHRSLCFVASPYVKRGFADSTHYSTASVLRTMELILGLRPMTQFDAAATPLWNAFQSEANLQPYEAVQPRIPIDQKNPAGSGGRPRRVENRRDVNRDSSVNEQASD